MNATSTLAQRDVPLGNCDQCGQPALVLLRRACYADGRPCVRPEVQPQFRYCREHWYEAVKKGFGS